MEPTQHKLFSIITPTYNCASKIEKTIKSVLSQNRDLFEYLVIDGGSIDDTRGIAGKYSGELRFVSEKDSGVYDAMNKGVRLSQGKYLYFLGAGDTLRAEILEKIRPRMPAVGPALAYGNVYMVHRGLIHDGKYDKAKLRVSNICHQAVFYERSIFDLIGGFDLRFRVLADYVLNIKCFGNPGIETRYLGYVIANYEGCGMSDEQQDPEFLGEFKGLAEQYLAGGKESPGVRPDESTTAVSNVAFE